MTGDVSNESVLQAIIAMAHKLGIKVIAEGVETITQRVSLQSADCDYAQGYLFPHPCEQTNLKTSATWIARFYWRSDSAGNGD